MPPKSGHHRARTVDYDDDDVYDDDYYEEEGDTGMTDDDREQLRLGTIQVKEALGTDVPVSDSQIHEALWHYYFDVGKSVSYLKNKFAPTKAAPAAEAKKPKPVSRFDQAASATTIPDSKGSSGTSDLFSPLCGHVRVGLHRTYPHSSLGRAHMVTTPTMKAAAKGCAESLTSLYPLPIILGTEPEPLRNFFWDTPWGNVPPERLGNMHAVPLYPPGRLLGGSAKPSKLAALAAARKKKQEEAGHRTRNQDGKDGTEAAVAMLDKLTVKSKDKPGSSALVNPSESRVGKSKPGRLQYRRQQSSPQPETPEPETTEPIEEDPKPVIQVPNIRTAPSSFGTILCDVPRSVTTDLPTISLTLPVPYVGSEYDSPENGFAGPSPDDIVLRAQGSRAVQG
ncbi:hypothetical protein M011DRAFT_315976 [Sporormia fimetaria CBS 119925]|uniref:HBS1-like protein N-terminal domain-containing protein n=1 Tax=Sporormia fimetaria CBS 119925 TaxID=1340428 RepID=A0A6A6UVR0_9PLEO|nr:hypothetical protein M011DRAFT_315976 [Sporormia fimetaria CBS 119925]